MMLRLWPLICDFDLKFVESELPLPGVLVPVALRGERGASAPLSLAVV